MLSINKTMEGIMAENNIGKITQVIGAVIDIKFTDGNLPEINSAILLRLVLTNEILLKKGITVN